MGAAPAFQRRKRAHALFHLFCRGRKRRLCARCGGGERAARRPRRAGGVRLPCRPGTSNSPNRRWPWRRKRRPGTPRQRAFSRLKGAARFLYGGDCPTTGRPGGKERRCRTTGTNSSARRTAASWRGRPRSSARGTAAARARAARLAVGVR